MELEPSALRLSTGLKHELIAASRDEIHAYLAGASRDGTVSRRHGTLRIAQADQRWLAVLRLLLSRVGYRSWSYREGCRNVWIIETSYRTKSESGLQTTQEQIAFVRGYFDAEGGIPRDVKARFYIQIVQKSRRDLRFVADTLEGLGIECGRLHNPSKRVDPHYWRFFVRARSQRDFATIVGSWHPRKRGLLADRWVGDRTLEVVPEMGA